MQVQATDPQFFLLFALRVIFPGFHFAKPQFRRRKKFEKAETGRNSGAALQDGRLQAGKRHPVCFLFLLNCEPPDKLTAVQF